MKHERASNSGNAAMQPPKSKKTKLQTDIMSELLGVSQSDRAQGVEWMERVTEGGDDATTHCLIHEMRETFQVS